MTRLQQMVLYLEKFTQARERKNKYKAIRNLIKKKFGITEMNDDLLAEIVRESVLMNRDWQRATQLYPDLRGTDYDQDKKILEQEAMIGLEYEPPQHGKILKDIIENKS